MSTPSQPDALGPSENDAEKVDASESPASETESQPTVSEPSQTPQNSSANGSSADTKADSSETTTPPDSQSPPAGSGPLSLARIRQLRKSQQKPAVKMRNPASLPDTDSTGGAKQSGATAAETEPGQNKSRKKGSRTSAKSVETGVIQTPEPAKRVEVPNRRQTIQELEDELSAALGGSDLDSMLIGDSMLQVGRTLNEGQRVAGRIVKVHGEDVFLSLGGPDEGTLPVLQFEEAPEIGAAVEVIIRGYSNEEGLYELTLPGNAIDVSDWADIREGEVVEALITGSNSGGLECKVGAIRGFIPASQVAEYRVENLAEMVDQKVLCVVTEANERRGNLVLSRRAVLEREKQEKRAQRLAAIAVGDAVEGTVTKILDFGAFVDIGGLDGLLHISQLSWERVNHPSEILEVGQKIQVRIEKIDEQSGKIGLSYRSLQEHPWTGIDQRFPVGSVVKGTVTRIAEFGAFVKIATGVEGLVHLSELAHHRVSKVSNVVQEGQEVEVKLLSLDEENQRISLSIKGAQAAPEPKEGEQPEAEMERPKPVLPKHRGPLKGGTGRGGGGEQFGLKW